MAATLTLDLGLLPPGKMRAPRIIGNAVESGMALSGVSIASDATGGGLVAVDYQTIWLGNTDQTRMRYFNRLAAMLVGGTRYINVPLMTDFYAPIAIGSGGFSNVGFSDTATFSDGTTYSQASASGNVSGDTPVGSGTLTLSLIGGIGTLTGGEWFGLSHPTKGNRAYCITDIDTSFTAGSVTFYTVGIRPTLRDVIHDLSQVTWYRPQCLMRLAPGTSPDMDIEQYWFTTPSLSFVEAF